MLKMKFLLVCFWLAPFLASSQANLKNTYLTSLIYLTSNENVKLKIKETFPYLYKKKQNCVSFNSYGEVAFIPIEGFDKRLFFKNSVLDTSIVNNRSLFNEKYDFESYTDSLLLNVLPKSNTNLFIIFSKPIGNMLLAEVLDYELCRSYKMGSALRFLFFFNDKGLVEKVFSTKIHYH